MSGLSKVVLLGVVVVMAILATGCQQKNTLPVNKGDLITINNGHMGRSNVEVFTTCPDKTAASHVFQVEEVMGNWVKVSLRDISIQGHMSWINFLDVSIVEICP